MLRQILEECQPGFAEVVLMLSNSATTAEVYTTFEDLKFSEDGNIVTFMGEGGTHLHMYLDRIKAARLVHTTNDRGLPSYSLWCIDEDNEPVLRVYMRKSEKEETNQPRHDLFMGLLEKYGENMKL